MQRPVAIMVAAVHVNTQTATAVDTCWSNRPDGESTSYLYNIHNTTISLWNK